MKNPFPTYRFVYALSLLLVLLSVSLTTHARGADPVQKLITAKEAQKALPFSSLFQGRGDGLTTCPVTGEKIATKKYNAEMSGRTVFFCCHGCLKAAKQNPEKFVKPTVAEQQNAVKSYLARATQAADEAEFCNE
jgi:YHS domain-containing protein